MEWVEDWNKQMLAALKRKTKVQKCLECADQHIEHNTKPTTCSIVSKVKLKN